MSEGTNCPHCGKLIDRYARLCLYCNRDPYVAPSPRTAAATAPPPPPPSSSKLRALNFTKQKMSTKALIIAAIGMLLMGSFAVGGLFYGLSTASPKTPDEERDAALNPESVPSSAANDVAMKPGGPMITSSPMTPVALPVVGTTTVGTTVQQGADATALPADEYAKIVEQHQKTPIANPYQTVADPRSVVTSLPGVDTTRSPEAQRPSQESAPVAAAPVAAVRAGGRYERPRPISQPFPDFKVQRTGTVRLNLTVGSDGNVREVSVLEGSPGLTAKTIAVVQRWRFKPATLDGRAVEGQFTVDISFNKD